METKPTRVLLIEDDPADARLIRQLLADAAGAAFDVQCSGRLSSGLQRLAEEGVDVVLLDLALPDSRGLDTFVAAHARSPSVPIVVLTGLDDATLAVQAVQQGAQDYLVKGEVDDGNLLARSLRYAVERKLAEEQIRRLNAELEQRVVERTKQLAAANKELEAFSYSASHDLRAPLHAIEGFSVTLLEEYADKLDSQGQHYLQRVRCGVRRMAELIDAMLNLSRMARTEFHRQPVDLSGAAGKIVNDLRTTDSGRQVDVVIAGGLVANGDPQLIHVVLQNLLGNAWKFTAKKPRARIELSVTQNNGETVYFVRDNGAGFDMAYADKLFGPFQRLHGQCEFEGIGIGLATVQRIICRHNGHIWAEGAVNQGATVYFTLESK